MYSAVFVCVAGLSEGSKRTLVKEEDGHACINVSLLEHLVMSSEVGQQQAKHVPKLCRLQFCALVLFLCCPFPFLSFLIFLTLHRNECSLESFFNFYKISAN